MNELTSIAPITQAIAKLQSIRDALEPPDHFQSTEALPTFTSEQIDKIVRDVLDEIRFDLEPTEP